MQIAIIGYGKMGHAIEEIAVAKGHSIDLTISIDNLQDFTIENLQKCDVAIEFSTPETAEENIRTILDAGIPVVSGSTGWTDHLPEIQDLCINKQGSFLYASNFSVGVNIFFALNKKLAELMQHQGQYKASIEEIHHTEKKDAPSGTAITLANQVIETLQDLEKWENQESLEENVLGIVSKREDPAPGTHIVKYASEVDEIEIIHTAHSRKGFAEGAVLAAEYIFGKKGVFTMADVLGF